MTAGDSLLASGDRMALFDPLETRWKYAKLDERQCQTGNQFQAERERRPETVHESGGIATPDLVWGTKPAAGTQTERIASIVALDPVL